MEIKHRTGKQHANADALSRKPCKQRGATIDWESKCSPVVSHVKAEELGSLSLKKPAGE